MPRENLPGGRFVAWREDAPEPKAVGILRSSDAMERKLAPADGIQIVNGKRFLAMKGEPLMPDAEFQAADAEEAPQSKQPGPSETTVSAGPSQTSEATAPALASMNRGQLNARAAELGIESPEKLPNIPAVIAAIEAKTGEATS